MSGMKTVGRLGMASAVVISLTLTATACGGGGDTDTPTTTTTVEAPTDTAPLVKNKPRKSQQITVTGGGRG
jgi:hypothetical protein